MPGWQISGPLSLPDIAGIDNQLWHLKILFTTASSPPSRVGPNLIPSAKKVRPQGWITYPRSCSWPAPELLDCGCPWFPQQHAKTCILIPSKKVTMFWITKSFQMTNRRGRSRNTRQERHCLSKIELAIPFTAEVSDLYFLYVCLIFVRFFVSGTQFWFQVNHAQSLPTVHCFLFVFPHLTPYSKRLIINLRPREVKCFPMPLRAQTRMWSSDTLFGLTVWPFVRALQWL